MLSKASQTRRMVCLYVLDENWYHHLHKKHHILSGSGYAAKLCVPLSEAAQTILSLMVCGVGTVSLNDALASS